MHCKKCKKYYVKKGVTISNRFLIWKTLNSFKTLVFKHYLKIPNFEKLSFLTVCMWSLWLVWVKKMQWLALGVKLDEDMLQPLSLFLRTFCWCKSFEGRQKKSRCNNVVTELRSLKKSHTPGLKKWPEYRTDFCPISDFVPLLNKRKEKVFCNALHNTVFSNQACTSF